MTDPKHLPPRDCMVLYQDIADEARKQKPYWMQVRLDGADGEYDGETGHIVGHEDQWIICYSAEVLDVECVIDFREMDVMG